MRDSISGDELTIDHFVMGIVGLTYAEAAALYASAKRGEMPGFCQHLGKAIETRACEGCGGKRIAIHDCAIHGECSLQLNRTAVRFCGACPDFTAKPSR